MKQRIKQIKWNGILAAVLAIIVGIVFVAVPQESADVLCEITGAVLVIAGIASIVVYLMEGFLLGGTSLVLGIVMLMAGFFCFSQPASVQWILTFLFGFFMIVDSSTSMVDSIVLARAHIGGWGGLLALSLVSMVLGALVLFSNFGTVMIYVGYCLIADGVCDLIGIAVFSRKIREAKKILFQLLDTDHVVSEQ